MKWVCTLEEGVYITRVCFVPEALIAVAVGLFSVVALLLRRINIDYVGEDEKCVVVVIVSAAFVLVVGFIRARCLFACCWLGCRSRGDRGRGSCWLLEYSVFKVTFQPSCAVVSHVVSLESVR